jgi:hypothetical protein
MWIITDNGPEDIHPPRDDDTRGMAWAHTKDVHRYLEGELPRDYQGEPASAYSAEEFHDIWEARFLSYAGTRVSHHALETDIDEIDRYEEEGQYDDVDWESE